MSSDGDLSFEAPAKVVGKVEGSVKDGYWTTLTVDGEAEIRCSIYARFLHTGEEILPRAYEAMQAAGHESIENTLGALVDIDVGANDDRHWLSARWAIKLQTGVEDYDVVDVYAGNSRERSVLCSQAPLVGYAHVVRSIGDHILRTVDVPARMPRPTPQYRHFSSVSLEGQVVGVAERLVTEFDDGSSIDATRVSYLILAEGVPIPVPMSSWESATVDATGKLLGHWKVLRASGEQLLKYEVDRTKDDRLRLQQVVNGRTEVTMLGDGGVVVGNNFVNLFRVLPKDSSDTSELVYPYWTPDGEVELGLRVAEIYPDGSVRVAVRLGEHRFNNLIDAQGSVMRMTSVVSGQRLTLQRVGEVGTPR